jgi:hypothetical protein
VRGERAGALAGGPAVVVQVHGFWLNGLMDIVGQFHLINLMQARRPAASLCWRCTPFRHQAVSGCKYQHCDEFS